jgi:hypothetical protein
MSFPPKLALLVMLCACGSDEKTAPRERPTPGDAGEASPAANDAGSDGGTDAAVREETRADSSSERAATAEVKKDPDSKFCGVLEVMRSDCQRCHAAEPVGGAPMPLVTYADFMAKAVTAPDRKVYELVRARVHDTARPMPPSPAQLTAAALASIDAWVDDGALEAARACPSVETEAVTEGADGAEVEWPADCEERFSFVAHDSADPSKPYQVPANTEEHPQFAFDAPWGDADVQILATRPITDKAPVLHHWILWDSMQRSSLRGWAPGGGFEALPKDIGMYAPKGAEALNLDMHYYNTNGAEPVADASGVEVCITRTLRPKMAANMGLNGSAVVAAMSRAETPVACEVTADQEVTFVGLNPHMHQLGVHAKLELTRAGMTSVLWDAPFSFHEQELHALDNIHVMTGDVLTTTCTFVNDKPVDVQWGESTDDEMCINWVRYYPRGAFRCRSMMNMQQP